MNCHMLMIYCLIRWWWTVVDSSKTDPKELYRRLQKKKNSNCQQLVWTKRNDRKPGQASDNSARQQELRIFFSPCGNQLIYWVYLLIIIKALIITSQKYVLRLTTMNSDFRGSCDHTFIIVCLYYTAFLWREKSW